MDEGMTIQEFERQGRDGLHKAYMDYLHECWDLWVSEENGFWPPLVKNYTEFVEEAWDRYISNNQD